MKTTRNYLKLSFISIILSLLVACGGGGNNPTKEEAPPAPPPPTQNQAPTVNAGSDQTVVSNQTVTLSGTASDSDGTISTYAWTQVSGLNITLSNANTATASFAAPQVSNTTQLTLTLTVTDDGGLTASDSVVITVNPDSTNSGNISVDAGTDQLIQSGNIVSLLGRSSGNNITSYTWTQISGSNVELFNSSAEVTTFTAPTVSTQTTLRFQLTVRNSASDVSSDTVDITISPADTSVYEVPRSTSRVIGVAPLNVFFTAGMNNSTANNKDFHDLHYKWNFNDVNSSNWGTSDKSRNTETGPVATHLFETAGVYNVDLVISDETGVIETDSFEITVLDADDFYVGNKTVCISDTTNNNFQGCPAAALNISTNDLSQLIDYLDSGVRVLLHRGSSWNVNSTLTIPANSTLIQIAAYGQCQSADAQGICQNNPLINVSGGSTFISTSKNHDLRLSDLNLVGTSSTGRAINGNFNVRQLLVNRIKTVGFSGAFSNGTGREKNSDYTSELSIISSNFNDTSGMTVWIGSERLNISGNIIADSKETHVVRIYYSYKGVVSHNILSGASYQVTQGLHALKFHGPEESLIGSYSQTGSAGKPFRSKFNMVANNIFGASGPWPVSIGPQNSVKDERVSDFIIEKNQVFSDYGTQNTKDHAIGMMVEGRYQTIRNNILDGSNTNVNSYIGINIARRGVEPSPLGNTVYNNTIYLARSSSFFRAVEIDASANDTIIRNNFASAPNSSSTTMVDDNSGNAVFDHNLLEASAGFIDPTNSNPLLRDFKLGNSSVAIDNGIAVPVFDDINDRVRSGTYSLGAHNK